MPLLHTPVDIPKIARSIRYDDEILSLGSCFSEHIGRQLSWWGYATEINPFGVLYNPVSIVAAMDRLHRGNPFGEEELFEHKGLYHSPMHHGSFSAPTAQEALGRINDVFLPASQRYHSSTVLCLTWGTARAYRDQTGRVVANCHKLPAAEFERIDYSHLELFEAVKPSICRYLDQDSSRIVVQTVSPIRHLGDGAHSNALSKAHLLLFAQALTELCPSRIFYFPAYELVLDELRDYRFYADDMTHPSFLAVQIVCERFERAMLDANEAVGRKEVESFRRFEAHRLLRPDMRLEHLQTVRAKKQRLQRLYPDIVL